MICALAGCADRIRRWTISGFPVIVFHEIPFSFQNITDAMQMVCEILTADPEGGAARIPFPLFQDLYKYLAQIDGEISQEHIDNVITHLQYDVYVLHELKAFHSGWLSYSR